MASARELVQGFLSAFGQQLGTELALDASGTCILRVYDSIDLVFEVLEEQEDGDRICLRSPLASIAGRAHLEVLFRDLLLYNFVVYTRTGAVLVHAGDDQRALGEADDRPHQTRDGAEAEGRAADAVYYVYWPQLMLLLLPGA